MVVAANDMQRLDSTTAGIPCPDSSRSVGLGVPRSTRDAEPPPP
jgi:hypothetical protein